MDERQQVDELSEVGEPEEERPQRGKNLPSIVHTRFYTQRTVVAAVAFPKRCLICGYTETRTRNCCAEGGSWETLCKVAGGAISDWWKAGAEICADLTADGNRLREKCEIHPCVNDLFSMHE